GRSFRATGADAIKLCERMLESYSAAAWANGKPPQMPQPVADLVKAARDRSAKKLLDDRAPADKSGKRRFTRGERYMDLPAPFAGEAPNVLKAYVAALGARAPKGADAWELSDAAWRIAGTGSLGVIRFALLVKAKDGDERIFDLKESRPSACGAFVGPKGATFAS